MNVTSDSSDDFETPWVGQTDHTPDGLDSMTTSVHANSPVYFERHVTRRCARMNEHDTRRTRQGPPLQVPCDECYSIESYWRKIPWELDSRTPVKSYPTSENLETP